MFLLNCREPDYSVLFSLCDFILWLFFGAFALPTMQRSRQHFKQLLKIARL